MVEINFFVCEKKKIKENANIWLNLYKLVN